MISSALDQSVLVEWNYNVEGILKKVDEQEDITVAIDFLKELRQTQQLSGLGMAELLFGIKSRWEISGIGEDFVDYIFADVGLSKQTVDKYTDLWETVFYNPDIPNNIKGKLYTKPIRGLLLLIGAVKDEQLDKDAWEAICLAPDAKTIRDIIREIRGDKTSSESAVYITMGRDGTLFARRGDGPPEQIGWLSTNEKASVTCKLAVDRILRNMEILKL